MTNAVQHGGKEGRERENSLPCLGGAAVQIVKNRGCCVAAVISSRMTQW